MKRIALLFFVCAIAFAPAMAQTIDRLACTGYPEPRIWLESQTWWDSAGLQPPARVGEHIHVGTCWPVAADGSDAIVTSVVSLDVRVMLHNSTGPTSWMRWGTESVTLGQQAFIVPASPDTTVWTVLSVDPARASTGRREIRMSVNIPDTREGKRQFNSTGWQLCFRACTPTYRPAGPTTEARGWYEGHDYQHAVFLSRLPVAPVSGLWTFTVRMVQSGPGGVFVDPDFHAGSEGMRLRDGGIFRGPVTLDTRALPNGPHRLVIVSSDGKSAGVLVIVFIVAN